MGSISSVGKSTLVQIPVGAWNFFPGLFPIYLSVAASILCIFEKRMESIMQHSKSPRPSPSPSTRAFSLAPSLLPCHRPTQQIPLMPAQTRSGANASLSKNTVEAESSDAESVTHALSSPSPYNLVRIHGLSIIVISSHALIIIPRMLTDSNPFAIYITPSCHFVIRSFFRSVVISYEADEGHPSLNASSV